jgi:hypothetical protein
MNPTVTLRGYLGKKPALCETKPRTLTRTRRNPVAEMDEPYEITVPSRDYMVLRLATRDAGRTTWHRLMVWNAGAVCHRIIRFSGVGDLVEVAGHFDTFSFPVIEDDQEKWIELRQLIVQSFRRLRIARRNLPPEIP